MTAELLTNELSRRIWNEKYRLTRADGNVEAHIDQMWRRVARALSSVEAGNTTLWGKRFYDALYGFRFIPGGRILAGSRPAGTSRALR